MSPRHGLCKKFPRRLQDVLDRDGDGWCEVGADDNGDGDCLDFAEDRMGASTYEQDLAASKGVRILTNAAPVRIHADGGAVQGVELAFMTDGADGLVPTGESLTLKADQVFKAIGQRLDGAPVDLSLAGSKIAVHGAGRTSVQDVWAGGDCATGGDDLTVTAVAQGRDAAEDIHQTLMDRTPL